jgi:hypothetical protein
VVMFLPNGVLGGIARLRLSERLKPFQRRKS